MLNKKMLMVLSGAVLALVSCGAPAVSSQPTSSVTPPASSGDAPEVSSEVAPGVSSEIPPEVSSEEETPLELAQGVQNYVYASSEERTKITAILEKYAVENKFSGLTLFGDGGYVLYKSFVKKGTNTYIPGYGFGILAEGELTADLAGENNPAWKRYWHTFETEDPATTNYMDDKGSVVGDLIGYDHGSYFETQMNEFGDNYEWVGSLATVDRPIALDEDPVDHIATKYLVPVKTGSALKYATNTTNNLLAAYNGREVQLEDYITPYKVFYTKAYNLARSADNLDGAGSIKGSRAYYTASETGFSEEAWKNIGIKAYVDETYGPSLEFTFNQACTPFYAMYYLSSGMYAPVPEQFLLDLGSNNLANGVKLWGKYSEDKSLTPLDTTLSTGPYALERWDPDQQIVYKKNPMIDTGNRYKIAGVHINILPAATEDGEAALREYDADKLHAAGVPQTKPERRTDPEATTTVDSSTTKLNLNTCDAETWEELFGVNGTITKTAKEDYWEVEPAMHNKDFVSGLSFAIDRKSLAQLAGRTPTANYFGTAYMSDPENGISYNSTQAHIDAVASVMEGTDGYGYSLEKAKASFKRASDQLIADGVYHEGDIIHIEMAWQSSVNVTNWGTPIENYIMDAWDDSGATLNLQIDHWYSPTWQDVYYKKMMVGQFDIGLGGVNGNTYDPLNFLEVLKSDNSSGFTLNWGLNTNKVDDSIVYDGKIWSFDALWTAADHGAYIEDGAIAPIVGVGDISMIRNADGSLLVTVEDIKEVLMEGVFSKLYTFCLYGANDTDKYTDYQEVYAYFEGFNEANELTGEDAVLEFSIDENAVLTCTFPAEAVAYFDDHNAVLGFDFYFMTQLGSADPAVGVGGYPNLSIEVEELPAIPAAE